MDRTQRDLLQFYSDSEKRVAAIYSRFERESRGELRKLWHVLAQEERRHAELLIEILRMGANRQLDLRLPRRLQRSRRDIGTLLDRMEADLDATAPNSDAALAAALEIEDSELDEVLKLIVRSIREPVFLAQMGLDVLFGDHYRRLLQAARSHVTDPTLRAEVLERARKIEKSLRVFPQLQ